MLPAYSWYTDLVLVLAVAEFIPAVAFLLFYRGRVFRRIPFFLRIVAVVAIGRSATRLMFVLMGGLTALLGPASVPQSAVDRWIALDLASGATLTCAVWLMFLLFVQTARPGEY